MQGFMPRFRRRIDRNSWIPIGEGESMHTSTHGAVTTSARLEGPPNFGDPAPTPPQLSPPPSYAQVRNLSRPEVSSLILRDGATRARPEQPPSLPALPAMNSTLVTLDDIRHQEVRNVQLDNRLSSVPNYPVFFDQPSPSRRRSRLRRMSSAASTTTANVFMRISQMPGTEPFDPSAVLPTDTRNEASDSQAILDQDPLTSPLMSPLSALEASVAQVMTVQRVQAPVRSLNATVQTSWPSDTSANFADRWDAPTEGYYSPTSETRPSLRTAQTFPGVLEQRAARQMADPRVQRVQSPQPRQGARDINTPPAPPPKDPGYVPRRPDTRTRYGGLRHNNSTPNLMLFPQVDRELHSRTRSEANSRAASRTAMSSHTPEPLRRDHQRKPSQISNLYAKLMHRSVPRAAVSCG